MAIDLNLIEHSLTMSGTVSKDFRDVYSEQLKAAYSELHAFYCSESGEPKRGLALTIAKVVYLYGRCTFGGKMESSRSLFELATTFQLVGMNLLPESSLPPIKPLKELENLPLDLAESTSFKELNDFLMNTSNEKIIESVQDSNKAFALALHLRWLLGAEQNLEGYNKHTLRLEKIFTLAKGILLPLKTPQSLWEIAGIIYNGDRYVQTLKDPHNVDSALEILNQLYPFIKAENGSLRSKELEAQVHNMSSVLFGKKKVSLPEEQLPNLREQYFHVTESVNIADNTPNFDPFLKILFTSNQIKIALKCQEAGIEGATQEELNKKALSLQIYMDNEGYSHYYHSYFLMNIAQLNISQNDLSEATRCLKKAAEVNDSFPKNAEYNQTKEIISNLLRKISLILMDHKK